MVTAAENELLCRVGPGTRMGAMLREYWHPFLRSDKLKPGGAPERVRLLGENFVAFRTDDGNVGFVDEACPHRCASLALARNEGDGLRCIYHGWKIGSCGKVLDVPIEQPERREAFAASVKVHRYPVREAGGLIWVFLQEDRKPPPFPALEFTALPDDHVDARFAYIHCNWIQAFEAVIDSAHLGYLHRSSGMQRVYALEQTTKPVRFEIEFHQYGFREAALRERSDGTDHARLREFVAPSFSFPPGEVAEGAILGAITVPVDDEWCIQIWVTYNIRRPLIEIDLDNVWRYVSPNRHNFWEGASSRDLWGQDREAMESEDHWSGFVEKPQLYEDFAVLEAMGPIVDRSKENLCSTDLIIAKTRRRLLQAIEDYEAGKGVWGIPTEDAPIDYGRIRSIELILNTDDDWRTFDSIRISDEIYAKIREKGGMPIAAE